MKKKNSMVTLVVLVAILVLGVGYAVVTGVNLTISGNASTVSSDLKVRFTGTPVGACNGCKRESETENPATVTATKTDDLTATIKVENLEEVGDTATATYTIENYESDLSANLVVGTITNSKNTFFQVTATLGNATIASGASTTVTVTVKLIKSPITAEDSSTTITVPITATPIAST